MNQNSIRIVNNERNVKAHSVAMISPPNDSNQGTTVIIMILNDDYNKMVRYNYYSIF